MSFHGLSASEIVRKIRAREFSVKEIVNDSLQRIASLDRTLNAMITVVGDRALERATILDSALASGEDPGPLTGVPVIVKDNMCTCSIPTTCASRILSDWKPPYNASVVEELDKAGAVILGKSNMDEFAMGSSTEHSAYGPCRNPWDITRVPGGSSGGSAAAVAAGYVPIALGSDTGGSIRQPAGLCGIYGLKPTYGLISRYGLIAFASSLDQIGPFARTVEDLALSLNVLARPDQKDSTCSREKRPDYLESLKVGSLSGKKVGIVREFRDYDLPDDISLGVEKVLRILRKAGAEIEEVSLPVTMTSGLGAYYIIAPAEASSNLARYDGVRYGLSEEAEDLLSLYLKTRKAGFGKEVKRRILTGTYVLSSGYYDAYYLTAQKVRQIITREFAEAFSRVDTLVMPTSPSPAFRIGELVDDPIQMYMMDVFTLPVNLAGLPGLSLNGGYTSEGLPVGVQMVGPRWGEGEILSMATVLERELGPARTAPGGVADAD